MKATFDVTHNNSHIAHEWYLNGRISDNTEYTRTQAAQGFRRKPKSDTTRANEAAERRYVNRANTCPECHMLKAVGTGTCGC